ncbi:uncharacterized protein LOC131606031 [Vicia villosa]|uniref:uncharacterized protein LOC131606031 n=1 Tax=Vicia villosa TaxID=3911 RepID=UPI00273C3D1B|nr:uncharacterized protein LOC131606031 [Vicia villosa]
MTEKQGMSATFNACEKLTTITTCNDLGELTYIGFGFATFDNLHKVVAMNEISGWACKIYVMELCQWRSIDRFPGIPVGMIDDPYGKFMKKSVYFKGFLIWLVTDEDKIQLWIVSLGLSRETFKQKTLPEDVNITNANIPRMRLGVLADKLSFSYYSNRELVVWRLENYTTFENWSMLTIVNLDSLPSIPDINPNQFIAFNYIEEMDILILQNYGRLYK